MNTINCAIIVMKDAFAASRGVTLPSQLRRELRKDARDLLSEFRALVPRREPVAIQRWSLRRAALLIWFVLLAVLGSAILLAALEVIGLS